MLPKKGYCLTTDITETRVNIMRVKTKELKTMPDKKFKTMIVTPRMIINIYKPGSNEGASICC